jgi:sorbitol-specific phosphotransferase system component IIC
VFDITSVFSLYSSMTYKCLILLGFIFPFRINDLASASAVTKKRLRINKLTVLSCSFIFSLYKSMTYGANLKEHMRSCWGAHNAYYVKLVLARFYPQSLIKSRG